VRLVHGEVGGKPGSPDASGDDCRSEPASEVNSLAEATPEEARGPVLARLLIDVARPALSGVSRTENNPRRDERQERDETVAELGREMLGHLEAVGDVCAAGDHAVQVAAEIEGLAAHALSPGQPASDSAAFIGEDVVALSVR